MTNQIDLHWGTGAGGSKSHLWPAGGFPCTSLCETAHCGDNGINWKTKKQHCKICERLNGKEES